MLYSSPKYSSEITQYKCNNIFVELGILDYSIILFLSLKIKIKNYYTTIIIEFLKTIFVFICLLRFRDKFSGSCFDIIKKNISILKNNNLQSNLSVCRTTQSNYYFKEPLRHRCLFLRSIEFEFLTYDLPSKKKYQLDLICHQILFTFLKIKSSKNSSIFNFYGISGRNLDPVNKSLSLSDFVNMNSKFIILILKIVDKSTRNKNTQTDNSLLGTPCITESSPTLLLLSYKRETETRPRQTVKDIQVIQREVVTPLTVLISVFKVCWFHHSNLLTIIINILMYTKNHNVLIPALIRIILYKRYNIWDHYIIFNLLLGVRRHSDSHKLVQKVLTFLWMSMSEEYVRNSVRGLLTASRATLSAFSISTMSPHCSGKRVAYCLFRLKEGCRQHRKFGAENQYYPSFSSIKQALVARIVNWRGSFSLFVYSLLTQTQDCRCVAYTTFSKNSPLFHVLTITILHEVMNVKKFNIKFSIIYAILVYLKVFELLKSVK
ncbi:hypothetical protein AGLY_006961 [Aphis glycines]|uniref:Uncharacterized protein n=1 Tax=Aphis glycines TaxID=307491 RepID=A0A6G0TQY3_APHGL|nr:hypothetical protein AGLY_006961 [Aphis glycines]